MHIKPKKRLGQNFLVDKNIQKKIVETCGLKNSDTVLEIGSGRGEITDLIAQKAGQVFALELDRNLCALLKERFNDQKNVEVINQDILKFNLRKYFSRTPGKIKVIGNIPYYISSPIIEHLFKFRDKIEGIFLTVQKEFAQRVVAPSGSKEYGSLSCFVRYFAEPKVLFHISKTCFYPVPKVDSSFFRLDIRRKLPLKAKDEKLLFKIIRAAFNKRRKTLRNSLEGVIPLQKLNEFFHKYGIDPNTRPEKLSLQDFINLANI